MAARWRWGPPPAACGRARTAARAGNASRATCRPSRWSRWPDREGSALLGGLLGSLFVGFGALDVGLRLVVRRLRILLADQHNVTLHRLALVLGRLVVGLG